MVSINNQYNKIFNVTTHYLLILVNHFMMTVNLLLTSQNEFMNPFMDMCISTAFTHMTNKITDINK